MDAITSAVARARARVQLSTEKTASATDSDGLVKEALATANAMEFMAYRNTDDGSAAGAHRKTMLDGFFAKEAAKGGPAESLSPTGVQTTGASAGKKRLADSGSGGDRPAESLAPTGQQATIGQEPAMKAPKTMPMDKKADDGGTTLFDMLTAHFPGPTEGAEKVAGKGGPAESVGGENSAAPPSKNENTNIGLLRSNTAPVSATKRQAKAPTLARLKSLLSNAGDTGPSHAFARAAFPKANSKAGGIKEASSEGEDKGEHKRVRFFEGQKMQNRAMRASDKGLGKLVAHPDLIKARMRSMASGAGKGGVGGALLGAGAGGVLSAARGGSAGKGALSGAIGGGLLGANVGATVGADKANKKFLAERGVKSSWAGMKTEATDEAKKRYGSEKKASLADYSELFKLASTGELGDEAAAWAQFIDNLEI